MRMPIFSYFLVVGAVLTALLIWLGHDGELESAPLRTSQQVGIPKPFKGRTETMPDITNANFAAARERPATERDSSQDKPAKVAAEPKRQKKVVHTWTAPARNWVAEYPHNYLMGIH
jgi:hypothetical protein